ncbi:SpoIIE family protein phosphatase [Streptomyces griseoflavus]|uniref:SpoIIE family protein phosphatase n=1 Tax=Streptomyces griseoflavus TaxID=35619 RepID=UPI0037FCCD96
MPPTGLLSWINRGHHPPVLIRGGRWTATLPCPPAHPLGTELGLTATLCREPLEPGDRVLFYTDGITKLATPAVASSARTSSPTSSSATTPTACPSQKPCAASCAPSWTTTADGSPTTPPSSAWNGTAPAATPHCAPPTGCGRTPAAPTGTDTIRCEARPFTVRPVPSLAHILKARPAAGPGRPAQPRGHGGN